MKLTFVFPCLNEEGTLGPCIDAVRRSLSSDPECDYEIVVADNGSTDRSRQIAEDMGARVVNVPERGYGAALRGGIEAAYGSHVMFADADSTYVYEHALPLYQKSIASDADMGIASRMTGEIEDGAMPWLHRYLGTPVLTTLINWFFGGKLTDCNSGFRCLRKDAYQKWKIRSSGMEFASELLIKALKADAKTVEISSGLRRAPDEREAHLRTWRDGMRHLLFILSERPQLFEYSGAAVAVLATVLQIAAFFVGPSNLFGLNVFDIHSKLLLLLAGLAGAQVYVYSCMLYLGRRERSTGLTQRLVHLDEGVLFFLLLTIFGGQALMIGGMVYRWAQSGFGGIQMVDQLLITMHFLTIFGTLAIGLTGLHVFKKGAGSRVLKPKSDEGFSAKDLILASKGQSPAVVFQRAETGE